MASVVPTPKPRDLGLLGGGDEQSAQRGKLFVDERRHQRRCYHRCVGRPPTFAAFYPVYLRMHSHPTCRRLHVAGNVLGLAAIVAAAVASDLWLLTAVPVIVNALAWVGHAVFQRNRPGV